MKPIIGIAGNLLTKHAEVFHDNLVTYTPQGFVDGVQQANGLPLVFPIGNPADAKAYIDQIDGLLLAGGQDVAPSFYGAEPSLKLQETEPRRDFFEKALIEEALKQKKPIFAVCRGIQILNSVQGGTLYQDLSEYPQWSVQHLQPSIPTVGSHSVSIDSKSHLASLLGTSVLVNSYHHQAIKELATDFVATAWSTDGLVEAYEAKDPTQSIVAVQWHPELMQATDEKMQGLFNDFIERARR
ncbi:gamma-glutamyl-gamma-aminobutyrate hydrolase family protein [Carnobacterium divergens]|uniref:gamma-glutamyl-gamma-aminobutyrate hydrolase family protein n=1 Tax=Carnobacterium divergens TaxID=2748 RepID=UPI0007F3EFAB|nr:gamma-glutamyl-gamma-aminobutyrate hydrolase family protein [Carnobacterium divergens]SBO16623.1 Protein NtpR [Carnobacterium divergens]